MVETITVQSEEKKTMAQAIFMVGGPGAGKSTVIKAQFSTLKVVDCDKQQKDREFKKAISSCKDLCASLYSLEEHNNIGTYTERIMAEHVLANVNALYRLWKSTLEKT